MADFILIAPSSPPASINIDGIDYTITGGLLRLPAERAYSIGVFPGLMAAGYNWQTGATGHLGGSGDTAGTGVTGVSGSTGAAGHLGAVGKTGNTGSTGTTGSTGPTGV